MWLQGSVRLPDAAGLAWLVGELGIFGGAERAEEGSEGAWGAGPGSGVAPTLIFPDPE